MQSVYVLLQRGLHNKVIDSASAKELVNHLRSSCTLLNYLLPATPSCQHKYWIGFY